MASGSIVVLTVLLLQLIEVHLHVTAAQITVDPLNGDDDSCLSVPELTSSGGNQSCETLDYAINGNLSTYYDTQNCSDAINEYSNVHILLKNGVHTLTSQLQIVGYSNVTVQAEEVGGASIQCVDFPNFVKSNFDNIFACHVTGLRFVGVVFEYCGPVSSNLYIYNVSDIEFHSCIFR